MKKTNLINIITYLFIVFALFIISCEESGDTDTAGGGTGGGTGANSVCDNPIEDKDTLVTCIEEAMKAQGKANTPDLNHIKLGAGLEDLSNLFSKVSPLKDNAPTTGFDAATFNGDISKWDTSKVTTMSSMFNGAAAFNQDIGNWNTDKVTDMSAMFNGAAAFKQNINTKEVTVGENTYIAWNTSNVTTMTFMFATAAAFNQDIGNWNTDKVTDMSVMFNGAKIFDQNINTKEVTVGENTYTAWNTSNVTTMNGMFNGASAFTQDIGNWNTSNVENMTNMFYKAGAFDQDIGNWNTDKVAYMNSMFVDAKIFDQNINTKEVIVGENNTYIAWNTSNVINMSSMFLGASVFSQDIGKWNIDKVTDMSAMFQNATAFNQDISTKDVTVTVGGTSYKAWNVGVAVRDMTNMFLKATGFNQDLTSWTWVSNPATNPPTGPNYSISVGSMFAGTGMTMTNAHLPKVCAEATAPYPASGAYVSSNCK